MTRIIAGEYGGRSLAVPAEGTRPTADRTREALFARLEHLGRIDGARVLDLYAGSGALALESLSRGAAHATCVESGRGAVECIEANATSLGVPLGPRAGGCVVVSSDVSGFLRARRSGDGVFDVVFCDPPYDVSSGDVADHLRVLATSWLGPDALVVVERRKRSEAVEWPPGFEDVDHADYGDTRLTWGYTSAEVNGQDDTVGA